jgi:hypothetical protein
MKDSILVELRTSIFPQGCSFSINSMEDRVSQVVSGLDSFFKMTGDLKEKFEVHFLFVDNTIGCKEDIPEQIIKILEKNSSEILLLNKNYYGSRNKGAGLIESWREHIDIILKYKWFLHFEPRTYIKKECFITEFCKSPRNLFKVFSENEVVIPHFYTGIFFIDPKKLDSFISSSDLESMVSQSVSIEYSLKDFMDQDPEGYSNYNKKLHIIWHDVHQDRLIEF